MTTDKRARQKANRATRVAEAEAAAARARMRSRFLTYGALAAVVVVAIIGISILASDDDDPTAGETDPGNELPVDDTTTTAPVEVPTPGVSAPPAGATIDGATECPPEDGSAERVTAFSEPPPMCIDESAGYTAVVNTTFGPFTIALDAAAAPNAVNNFVVLSRYGYFDGAPFHRIIPGFVIQGGDAVGDPLGTGSPGYTFADELPEAGAYEVGSVAMANSGPDTNGSQFFVITGDQGVALTPDYSLFGTVTEGLDVVSEIEAAETTTGDIPVESIVIESVEITQG